MRRWGNWRSRPWRHGDNSCRLAGCRFQVSPVADRLAGESVPTSNPPTCNQADTMARQIGFIGVGTMGRPMAINLLRAGYAVTVYDIVPAAGPALVEHGAQVAGSAREAAAAGEVVITMLPAS